MNFIWSYLAYTYSHDRGEGVSLDLTTYLLVPLLKVTEYVMRNK